MAVRGKNPTITNYLCWSVVYTWRTKSKPWLLMPWRLVWAGHQQQWYCLWKIYGPLTSMTIDHESYQYLKIMENASKFLCFLKIIHLIKGQISNIRHTLVSNKIVGHSDVVGASPVRAAPTTSSFPILHLASMDWAETTAKRDENHLYFGIWFPYIRGFIIIFNVPASIPLVISTDLSNNVA